MDPQESRLKNSGIACLVIVSAWIGWRAWTTTPFRVSVQSPMLGLQVPERIDFPAVPLGGTVEKLLEIKNGSDSEVTIFHVEASCGCTQVKSRKVTLGRNEVVQFPVIMHGWSYSSMAGAKTIRLDTSTGKYMVEVHTQGIAGLGVSPTVHDFGRIAPEKLPATLIFNLFAESLTAQQRASIRATCPHPSVEVGPVQFDDQGTGSVSVTIGLTPVTGLIWSDIEFTGDGIDTFRSSINAQVEGGVSVRPSSLVVRAGSDYKMEIVSHDKSEAAILKMSTSSELASYLNLSHSAPNVVECHLGIQLHGVTSPVLRGYILIDVKSGKKTSQVLVPVTAILK